MSAFRFRPFRRRRQEFSLLTAQVGEVARQTLRDTGSVPNGPDLHNYEPPQIMVIGGVRDLTTGSTSSGNKDANSQYYW